LIAGALSKLLSSNGWLSTEMDRPAAIENQPCTPIAAKFRMSAAISMPGRTSQRGSGMPTDPDWRVRLLRGGKVRNRSRAAFDHNSITPRVRGTSNVTWFAEDAELDFAKTASKGNLSGGDVLIAEEDYGAIIVGALDSERLVVYGSGQIGTADLGAKRGALRSDLDRHPL
jgi:hypothetical protein